MHTYIHTYIHTYMHTYIHTHTHTHTYVHNAHAPGMLKLPFPLEHVNFAVPLLCDLHTCLGFITQRFLK